MRGDEGKGKEKREVRLLQGRGVREREKKRERELKSE